MWQLRDPSLPRPIHRRRKEGGGERASWCAATPDQRGVKGAPLPRRVPDWLRSLAEEAASSRGDPCHADIGRAAGRQVTCNDPSGGGGFYFW